MSPRYLLDTNVLSEPLRPSPDAGILAHLRRHEGEIATASIVWHELQFGMARLPPSRKRDALDAYLTRAIEQGLPVLPYDIAAARWHAEQRRQLEAKGRTPPFADGQIAAIAAIHDLVVVTANRSDFEIFEGLTVEDWRSGS